MMTLPRLSFGGLKIINLSAQQYMLKALMQATSGDKAGESVVKQETDNRAHSVEKVYQLSHKAVLCGSHFRSYSS